MMVSQRNQPRPDRKQHRACPSAGPMFPHRGEQDPEQRGLKEWRAKENCYKNEKQ